MPQISPMKWIMLNFLTQSCLIQITSFLHMKKTFNKKNSIQSNLLNYKINWKW